MLKFCPLTISDRNRFVCENEARSHAYIASSTRCARGPRCECSPHAIPIVASWIGGQIDQDRFGMDVVETERSRIYRCVSEWHACGDRRSTLGKGYAAVSVEPVSSCAGPWASETPKTALST